MFELVDNAPQSAVIKVVGVGGGGGNAVQHMVARQVEGVDFIAANTDAQALKSLEATTILQLGASITKGLGAGADPEIGRLAAMEDRDRISEVLSGADMVFITAGMGGGTGTGGAPVVAKSPRSWISDGSRGYEAVPLRKAHGEPLSKVSRSCRITSTR